MSKNNFILKAFLALIFIICTLGSANATFITAADLEYTCLGSNRYRVQLVIYTECGTPIGDLGTQGSINVFLESPSQLGNGAVEEITLLKQSPQYGEEIKIFCEQNPSNCTVFNADRGLEKYTYSAEVNLSQYGSISDDWLIYWKQESRSSEVNVFSQGVQAYYVEARIKSETGCNSSPRFGQNSIVRGCVGEENTYNLFPDIPSNHSLEFEFVNPKNEPAIDMGYASGFSKDFPVSLSTPIEITTNGEITFSPTVPNQVGITDLLIREYDNSGKEVSRITKGIQVNTFNCGNNKPIISGLNNVDDVFEKTFCVGDYIDDQILGIDLDVDDNVSFSLIRADKPSVINFVQGNDTAFARFNWLANPSDVGSYIFDLELKDDRCPINQSITQRFVINIAPLPEFDLGDENYFKCNKDTVLTAESTVGQEPYNYEWFMWDYFPSFVNFPPTIDTITKLTKVLPDDTKSIVPEEFGGYAVIITDDFGCQFSDSLYLKNTLSSGIGRRYLGCQDSVVFYTGVSEVGDIVRTDWEIEPGGFTSSELDSIVYYFPDSGFYQVQRIMEDEVGCIDTSTTTFKHCELPEFNLVRVDSCEETKTTFIDSTDYPEECQIILYQFYINGVLVNELDRRPAAFGNITYSYQTSLPDSGWYDVRLDVETSAGCLESHLDSFYYYPRPKIEFLEDGNIVNDFYINCDDPDTTLNLVVIDSAGGGLTHLWTISGMILQGDSLLSTSTTSSAVDIITDVIGCKDTASIQILDPINANFKYDIICDTSESITFTNLSSIATKLKSYEWDFGYGPTSNDENPIHDFPELIIYQVELTVTDTNNCVKSKVLDVYNTTVIDSFYLSKDFDNDIVCVGNPIVGKTAFVAPDGSVINDVVWNWGAGDRFSTGSSITTSSEVNFSFNSFGSNKVTARVRYNGHPSVHSDYCIYEYQDEVEIFPRLSGTIRDNRVCLGDEAEFQFFRNGNVEDSSIVSTNWYFMQRNEPRIQAIYTTDKEVGDLLIREGDGLDLNIDINVEVDVVDTNGCKYTTSSIFPIIETNPASIIYEPGCSNEEVKIDVYHDNSQLFRILTEMYIEDSASQKRLFNDPNEVMLYALKNTTNNKFPQPLGGWGPFEPGVNPVKVFIVNSTIDGYGLLKECRSVLDTQIVMYDLPVPGFSADTVCSKYFKTSFTDTSSINVGEIVNWGWIFEDGTEIKTKDAQYILRSGSQNIVSHYAISDSGCVDTVSRPVYVHPTPDADFSFDSLLAEAFIPIDFYDESNFYQTTPDSSWYEFGDGSDREETFDATHIYDSIKVYYVTHAVNNDLGCWDTISKRTDLNVYLDLPTAFSPNNDGINDGLTLIHKGIRELYEFKVYNRWGEVVFDAEGDVKASWDGTFRGLDQEIGGYVAHVKALGAYDREFNFKRNISLIR